MTSLYGEFGQPDGSFSILVKPGEDISLRAVGKQTTTIHLSDSLPKDTFFVHAVLKELQLSISQVTIFAPRELDEIHDDIQELGYDKNDYMLSGIEAAQSPITFLYQQFSKKEKEKRKAFELTNEARRRDLLKELFSKYAEYDIISLNDKEFDEFVDFLNVSDTFMKNSTQYEFVVYVKQRFQDWVIYERNKGMDDDDYNYDQD